MSSPQPTTKRNISPHPHRHQTAPSPIPRNTSSSTLTTPVIHRSTSSNFTGIGTPGNGGYISTSTTLSGISTQGLYGSSGNGTYVTSSVNGGYGTPGNGGYGTPTGNGYVTPGNGGYGTPVGNGGYGTPFGNHIPNGHEGDFNQIGTNLTPTLPRKTSRGTIGTPTIVLNTRRTGLKSRSTQLLGLRFGWVVLVVWFEVGEFFSSLSSCKFPDSILRPSSPYPPTHVVLLADPHVPHPRLSYAPDSNPWLNMLRQAMDELFMRKSWNVVMRLGRVDVVLVLGDMLDWGRGVMSDQDYDDYVSLFRSIFRLPASTPMFFVPGNHDVPLGPNPLFSPLARDRYSKHFSPPNAILPIANHSLILLDAVGLVEEDYRRYAAEMQFGEWDGVGGGVIEFVKALGEERTLGETGDPNGLIGPAILISHIPLARPEKADCGSLRERGRIAKGAGPGYQNLLGSETTRFLLDVIKPSVVFSGDDHDYCEYTHPPGIREVTVKSFSSSTGIRRPGFQLLSLVPPPLSPSPSSSTTTTLTHADRPCFLPDQLGVYNRVYLPLAIATCLWLLFTNLRSAWKRSSGLSSIYSELKSRLSPNMSNSDQMPNSATLSRGRISDRPVPLTLPSRKSSQHLLGMTSMTSLSPLNSTLPKSARSGSFGLSVETPSRTPSRSAPVSPSASPRLSYDDSKDDEESCLGSTTSGYGYGGHTNSGHGGSDTPSLSRRSSYIYMHSLSEKEREGGGGGGGGGSYFLPIPTGLGLSTPNSLPQTIRRVSSNLSRNGQSQQNQSQSYSNQNQPSDHSHSHSQNLIYPQPNPPRRVTLPRMLSTSDWTSAAKAKDKSVFGLMVDSLPSFPNPTSNSTSLPHTKNSITNSKFHKPDSRSVWKIGKDSIRWIWGLIKWGWRSRNGVLGRTGKEVWAIAWPSALVWLFVNGLFFLSWA